MKTQPLASSIMLAGLTRGVWMGAPADRCPEHRNTSDATGWRSPPASQTETPGITSDDRAAVLPSGAKK